MAVLVTRPHPDNEATARALRERGFEVVLAPMLRFEALPLPDDIDADAAAVVVTSANALRAIEASSDNMAALKPLPLFAVGKHTAEEARRLGFGKIVTADGDAAKLRETLRKSLKGKKARRLLYFAGADLSRDLAGELEELGFEVVTCTTYRMAAVSALPRLARDAFAAGDVQAVLHYSRRSARAFVEAVRAEGIEVSALAVPHCCLSANVAAILREDGAMQVLAAAKPDENALFEALERALRP